MEVSIEDIKLYNPQMAGGLFDVPDTKRKMYSEIVELVQKPQIISIVGLRRVGKTVLIKQILNHLIDRGKYVFYFSFDEERYAHVDALDKVIRFALNLHEKPVIALDEIGRIDGWAGVIKKYYDTKKTKFLLSGSASLEITKGKESLAGRIYDLYLPPLQYPEFLEFLGEKREVLEFKLHSPEKAFVDWTRSDLLDDFIKKGGFPEMLWEKDDKIIRKYVVNNCIEKIIFEDLPKVFGINNEHALYSLWEVIVRNPGLLFVPSNMEDVVGISRNTIKDYVFYLQKAYLLKIIERQGSVYSRKRKADKVYPITSCISSLMGGDDAHIGNIVEIAVFDKLYNGLNMEVEFFRDKNKREVDFIVNDIPIEVKFKNNITKQDCKNTKYYLEKKGKETGMMVTKNTADIVEIGEKKIVLIPLDMFLQIENIVLDS